MLCVYKVERIICLFVYLELLLAVVSVCLLLSFPNKQKSSDSSTAAMTSAMGSNLSELDRLLLELNAVQQSSPSFPTTGTHTHSLQFYQMCLW